MSATKRFNMPSLKPDAVLPALVVAIQHRSPEEVDRLLKDLTTADLGKLFAQLSYLQMKVRDRLLPA
jgi:hypothetical protein